MSNEDLLRLAAADSWERRVAATADDDEYPMSPTEEPHRNDLAGFRAAGWQFTGKDQPEDWDDDEPLEWRFKKVHDEPGRRGLESHAEFLNVGDHAGRPVNKWVMSTFHPSNPSEMATEVMWEKPGDAAEMAESYAHSQADQLGYHRPQDSTTPSGTEESLAYKWPGHDQAGGSYYPRNRGSIQNLLRVLRDGPSSSGSISHGGTDDDLFDPHRTLGWGDAGWLNPEDPMRRLNATKKPKPKKPRKPEEVWYDVHKHPEGVPGGMGKSPEHHLRRRGWEGHTINEAGGRKTIQYRNHDFPDFVVSYGGGTSQKPDHNFRVLYMGTNRNIPKVHHVYSVADAMNKVEELQKLDSGLVVQPMTAHQAAAPTAVQISPANPKVFKAPPEPDKEDFPDMTKADDLPFPQRHNPTEWSQSGEVKEIPPPPRPKPPTYPTKYTAALLELARQPTWDFQKLALGDLTYGPGHPREGELMTDDDAHKYLMSGRHQTVKEVAPGVTPEEHDQIMGQIPEMDPTGALEYSLNHPARGIGSDPRIWMRKNQGEPASWSTGYNDDQGRHAGYLAQRVGLPEALSMAEGAGRAWGWLD